MKTYRQLIDFVTSQDIAHECVPMKSSYSEICEESGKAMVNRNGVTKGLSLWHGGSMPRKGGGMDMVQMCGPGAA